MELKVSNDIRKRRLENILGDGNYDYEGEKRGCIKEGYT